MKKPVNKISLPISPDLVAVLDKWRGLQPGVPSRSEVIRRIIAEKLESEGLEVPENDKG